MPVFQSSIFILWKEHGKVKKLIRRLYRVSFGGNSMFEVVISSCAKRINKIAWGQHFGKLSVNESSSATPGLYKKQHSLKEIHMQGCLCNSFRVLRIFFCIPMVALEDSLTMGYNMYARWAIRFDLCI